jgi:hypothetical protein
MKILLPEGMSMKKLCKFWCLVFLLAAGLGKAHAGGAAAAAVATAIQLTQLEHLAATIANGLQIIESVQVAYNQLKYGIKTAEAAIQNLKSFDPSKMNSLDDWMDYVNRQLTLERRTEAIFAGIRISAGGNSYGLMDSLEIPEAVVRGEIEQWNSEFTDRERKRIWTRFGLRPANYYYMKTWQEREKALVEKMAAKPEALAENQQETAVQVDKVMTESRSADSANALSQAQIEMQGIQTDQLMEINRQLAEQSALMSAEAQLKKQVQMPLSASNSFLKRDPAFD